MATEKNIKINVDDKSAKDATNTLGGLEDRLESLQDELKGVEVGSEAFKELQTQIAQTSSQVRNIELNMEGLDMEQRASELKSVAGGFADMAGGMALVAGSNKSLEELVQLIAQVEGATKIVTGGMEAWASANKLLRSGILQSAQAIRIMRTALIGLGIGAVVVAVGELSGAFNLFGKESDKNEKKLTRLQKIKKSLVGTSHRLNEAVAEEASSAAALFGELRDVNTEGQRRNDIIEKINSEYGKYLPKLLTENSTLDEIEMAYAAVTESIIRKIAIQQQQGKIEEVLEPEITKLLELRQKWQSAGGEMELFSEVTKLVRANLIEVTRGGFKPVGEVTDSVRKTIQELNKVTSGQNFLLDEAVINLIVYGDKLRNNQSTIGDIIELYGSLSKEQKKFNHNTGEQVEVVERTDKMMRAFTTRLSVGVDIINDLNERLNHTQQLLLNTPDLLAANMTEWDRFLGAFHKTALADNMGLWQDYWIQLEAGNTKAAKESLNAWVNNANQVIERFQFAQDMAVNFNNAITEIQRNKLKEDEKLSLEQQKKIFKREKAFQISQAIIDGASAAVKGISMFGPPPSALGITSIVAAGAVTAAQIAAIAGQQFNPDSGGSSGGSSSPSVPNTGGGAASINQSSLFATGDVSEEVIGGPDQLPQQKVVVLEHEITQAQQNNVQLNEISSL